MQNKRPQESNLVTETKYFNDSKTKEKPGVCANNLTQLHFLLTIFQNNRGILSEGMMVFIFPTLFLALPLGRNQTILYFQQGAESTASLTAGQTCTNTAALYLALYILQSDTHLKQHNGCNKTFLKQIKPFLKIPVCLKYSIDEMSAFLQRLTFL